MQKSIPGTIGRALLALGLVLSFLTVPSVMPKSHGANSACSPTVTAANSSSRRYVFTSTTTCDWVIPANWNYLSMEFQGGGGGGGGGSWAGSTGGGGGGGAPATRTSVTDLNVTPGNVVTISVGTGGTGGTGASTQGTTTGSNGNSGSTTSFAFSLSDSYTADGGGGGFGGSSDVGGAGGTGGGYKGPLATRTPVAGGTQNSGNGGEGKYSLGVSTSATSTVPGFSATSPGFQGLYGLNGGGGGARTGTNVDPTRGGQPSIGGSSVYAAQAGSSNSGSGGGGGAGCSGASATCANKNGASGANGYLIVYGTLALNVTNQNRTSQDPAVSTAAFAVGIAPSFPTLSTSGVFGSPTFSVSPALPAGLSLNTSTGVLSGTPTTATAFSSYTFYLTDGYGTVSNGWSFQINKGTGLAPTFTATTLIYGVPTALSASGGSGTGAFTFSSSTSDCILSGTRGETVTAQKSSGTCAIVAQKAGDSNWYSASKSASFTLAKQPSTISLSASPSSPREEGGTITLIATTGAGQSGTVTFSAGGSAISSCGNSGAVTISGTSATCLWTPSASGSPFTVGASYGGDSNYQSVSASTLSYTIYPSISLSYPGISTTFGTSKTSTPTISGGTGSSSSWSWSVVKESDSSTVSGITINGSGVISASSSVSTGTYAMRATATDTAGISKSANLTVVVGLSTAASPTISARESSMTAGGTVHLTSTVISAATGTVTFKVGASTISGCSAVAISSGTASCDWVTTTAVGSPFSLTAVYSGDSSYSSSTSAALSFSLVAAGTFTYSAQSMTFGGSLTATPVISGGVGNFSSWAIVKASDSSTVSGLYINTSGVVTISSSVAAGSYALVVTANDQNGVAGTGTLALTITQATTTISLTAQTITGVVLTGGTLGRQVRLVATLNVPVGGSVVVSDALGTICTIYAYSTNGECWWAPSDASHSPYALTATFAGNANASAATSNTLTNFTWNPAVSVSWTNRSVETKKTITITPTVSGGTGATTTWQWAISQHFTGYVIGGITISSAGIINVSGEVKPAVYAMDIQTGDLAGSYYYSNITITVSDLVAPDFLLSFDNETLNVGAAFTPYSITNSGSDIDSFSLDQSLPAGLALSTSTGIISGTPTETVTALVLTLTAANFAGIDTATFTLTVNPLPGGGSTITISLAGGATTAAKGTAVNVIATINVSGKVKFLANGKVLGGCAALSGSSTVSCSWKPTVQGQNVSLTAILNPTSNAYSTVKSAALNVGVGRRTGRR